MVETSEEFKLSADPTAPRVVSSKRQLAAILGCSERTVSNMLIEPGNPGTNTNGSYNVEAWLNFYAARDKSRDEEDFKLDAERASLKFELQKQILKERTAKAALADFNARERRGDLISASKARGAVRNFALRLRALHFRACSVDLATKIATELALPDVQAAKISDILEEFHREFTQNVHDLLPPDLASEETKAEDPTPAVG